MLTKLKDKKVIFFDNGNTLINYHSKNEKQEKKQEELAELYLYAYLNERFPSVTLEDLKEGFLEPWKNFDRKEKEASIDEMLNKYLEKHDGYLPYPDCINAMVLYFQPTIEVLTYEKGIADTLRTLRDHGYRLAIIANSPYYKEVIKDALDEAGIDDIFEEIILSYDAGMCKPNPEIYEYAMRLMKVKPSECIMVGDSLRNDMAPASKLGLKCYWLNVKNDDNYLEVANVTEIDALSDLVDKCLVEETETITIMSAEDLMNETNSEEDDDFDVSAYVDED